MIITDRFVMINFPKTGSTFVRKCLKKIHSKASLFDQVNYFLGIKKKSYFENLWLPSIRNTKYRDVKDDEHGTLSQIPEKHAHKDIASVIRDPYDRLISIFEYGHWKKSPWIDIEILKQDAPNFPEINFEEFVRLWNLHNPLEYHPKINKKLPVGPMTSQFILFFFKNPFEVLKKIDKAYIESNDYKNDMGKLTFLNQANLNHDLHAFLLKHGYPKKEIEFILEAGEENTSTPKDKLQNDYFSNNLLSFVKERESFLIRILKEN